MRRAKFKVKLRDQAGNEHDRMIFAPDEAAACERAMSRARTALGKTMADRCYARFEVLSCEPAAL
jgi:hypothetical protein